MSKFILGIGMPGSGKSTVLRKFSSKNNYAYVSPDEIRGEISGNPADQSRNREVWELARSRLREFLGQDQTVVFDATSTSLPLREQLLEFARTSGADKIQGVWVDTPYETALERNAQRERNVPEHVIEMMHNQLEENIPQLSDGFDSIFRLNEELELEEIVSKSGAGSELHRTMRMR